MATWPSALPRPRFNGYSVKPGQAFVRTDMETGAARQRKRSSSAPEEIALSIMAELVRVRAGMNG